MQETFSQDTIGAATTKEHSKIAIEKLNAWYGDNRVLKDISLSLKGSTVTAIMGPSGCGKSTLIRCINRLHEVVYGAHSSGKVIINGEDIYNQDVVAVRHKIGMVFQKPNPFPTFSIYDNVAVGLKLNGSYRRIELDEIVERSLRRSALWDEVKDRLYSPSTILSGGQQQRLCIARALAIGPEVILMDEPCSALDPVATAKIEELINELKKNFTVIIVTHNMQQAARVSDHTAFLLLGELIEYDATSQIFTTPKDNRTEQYITGRFG